MNVEVKIATRICVSVYTDALTYGQKYEALSHNSEKHQIKVRGDNNRIRWFSEYCFDLTGTDVPHVTYIRIEAEEWAPGEWNPEMCNSDVTVTLSDGTYWTTTFITFGYIALVAEKNKNRSE